MLKIKKLWIGLLVGCLVAVVCALCLLNFQNNAFAEDTPKLENTVTMMGKVVDSDGDGVTSPKFNYLREDGTTELYYGALDGGFMFAMPSDYDCTLTVYDDEGAYYPKTLSFSAEELIAAKPVYRLGNIVLCSAESCVSVSGTVLDKDFMTPIEGASVSFTYETNNAETISAVTDDNGAYNLILPKNVLGTWTIEREGYDSYTSEPVSYDADSSAENFSLESSLVYTVVFNSNGGSEVQTQYVKRGKLVQQPEDPVYNGYEFDGWYDDAAFSNKYDFSTKVDQDMELYAKWTQNITPENLTVTSTNTNQNAQTGDANMLGLAVIALVLSISAGFVVLSLVRKRRLN